MEGVETDGTLYARGLRPKVSAAWDLLREYGPSRFAFRILPWLTRRRYIAFTQSLADLPAPRDGGPGLTISLAEPAAAGALARFRPGYYPPALVERRLREGHLCFLVEEGGRLVHVRWFFVGPVFLPYLGRILDIVPGEAYADEAFTPGPDRRRGIHFRAGVLLRHRLREAGFSRYTNLIASWNEAALRTMERLGVAPAGGCGTAGSPGRKRFFVSGGVKVTGEGRIAIAPPDSGSSPRI